MNSNKQRLFEVMGKVDPTFKPMNEIFGWSEKEKISKEKQQQIEQAKIEVSKGRPGATVFAQPGSWERKDVEDLMRVRLNLVHHDMPTLAKLFPKLVDPNQGYVSATFLMEGNQEIKGFILGNWSFVVGNNGYVEMNNGTDYLINMLNKL